jgi:hypothetical protein
MKKLILIPVLLLTTTATAESLEERKYWKGQMDYLQRSLDAVEAQCGFKPTFDFVDKPKLREASEKAGHSPYGICAAIVDEVESLCREGDDEKASVKAKIKGFSCGYAKPRKLDFTKGVVKYMGNNDESNFSDWAKPWLMKKL